MGVVIGASRALLVAFLRSQPIFKLRQRSFGAAAIEQRIAPSPEASAIFQGASADRAGVQAIKRTRDNLLVIGGLQSMIPGSIRPALDTVDVPVFLGLGDRDIAGPPHEIPASFPNSSDVTLAVLPETGHCQFIFPSRGELFRRIGEWTSFVIRHKGLA